MHPDTATSTTGRAIPNASRPPAAARPRGGRAGGRPRRVRRRRRGDRRRAGGGRPHRGRCATATGGRVARWSRRPGHARRTSAGGRLGGSSSATCWRRCSRPGSTTATRPIRWRSSWRRWTGSRPRAVRAGACPATGACSRTCRRSSRPPRGRRVAWTRPSSDPRRDAGAFAITGRVFGELDPIAMVWRLTEIACYLRHLRLTGVGRARANSPTATSATRPLDKQLVRCVRCGAAVDASGRPRAGGCRASGT